MPEISDPHITLKTIQSVPTSDGSFSSLTAWVTNFQLAIVALDPFSHESSWILNTGSRILQSFSQADCRVAWLVTGTKKDAEKFLGPLSQETLTFIDPKKEVIRSWGVERLPAFLHINHAPAIIGCAQGWNPNEWRQVAAVLAQTTRWKQPLIPKSGDPAPYQGALL